MSTIEKYKEDRATLIASERALRFDAVAIASASENETRAAEIVHKLKTREAKDIWNAKKEQFMYPGMEFLFAKDTISEFIHCISFNVVWGILILLWAWNSEHGAV